MISKYQVMSSNEGYYIGRDQDGEPYDRISPYFNTREQTQRQLDNMLKQYKVKDCGCLKWSGIVIRKCTDCQMASTR